MAVVTDRQAGWKIFKLLGINQKYIRKATIHIAVDSIITAEIECLVSVDDEFIKDENGELVTELKKYRLEEIKE